MAMQRTVSKVLVIGLDCVPPGILFDRWRRHLPVLDGLMQQGVFGPLRSTDPPITVPAWMSMMTGLDPGQLGLYGFRNRLDPRFPHLTISRSDQVSAPTVWDILGARGLRSVVVGVPLTYPPRPFPGTMVTGMLTPSSAADWTHPPGLRDELTRAVGTYPFDVDGYRHLEPEALVAQLMEDTRRRFAVASHLLEHHPWDLGILVETGPDRLHHRFWRYMDPAHPRYEPDHPLGAAALGYYRALDAHVGALLERVSDDTVILVVSDHGARPLHGGVCVNELLVRHGWLKLRHSPPEPRPLTPDDVDWTGTRAWAEGGYYARVFLNVRGREAHGIVHPRAAPLYRERLKRLVESAGTPAGTRVLLPERLYREVQGVAPDLMIYFGDLDWRAVGTIGHGALTTPVNDTGPDDANHDPLGVLVLHDPSGRAGRGRRLPEVSILDVAPTLLRWFGIEPLERMSGHSIT